MEQLITPLSDHIYTELRSIAAGQLRMERGNHTLQATALVHEAYLKLRNRLNDSTISPGDFLAAAAQAMRRILVDHARTKKRQKRGGDAAAVDLDPDYLPAQEAEVELVELDAALDELRQIEPDAAKLVELRFFAGLSVEEAADVMKTSPRSAARLWNYARAWLFRRIQG